jgi:hypothetical protein
VVLNNGFKIGANVCKGRRQRSESGDRWRLKSVVAGRCGCLCVGRRGSALNADETEECLQMPPTLMSSAHDISTCLLSDRSTMEYNTHRELYIHDLHVHATMQSPHDWRSGVHTGVLVRGQRLWCLQVCSATLLRLELNKHRPLQTTQRLPLDLQYDTQVQLLLGKVFSWNFNIFHLDTLTFGRPLLCLCLHLFNKHNLLRQFTLDINRLSHFFCLIEEGYHCSNPYHNAVHAADVTQAMNCFITESKVCIDTTVSLFSCLTVVERLSCLLCELLCPAV